MKIRDWRYLLAIVPGVADEAQFLWRIANGKEGR
jgi:hypothetical protein